MSDKLILNKLGLSVEIILSYLKNRIGEYRVDEFSKETKLVTVKLVLNKQIEVKQLKIVVVEIEVDKECMVSVVTNSESLAQSIFNYHDDLSISSELQFPLNHLENGDYESQYTIIDAKLKLPLKLGYVDVQDEKRNASGESRELKEAGNQSSLYPSTDLDIADNPTSRKGDWNPKRPDDMPGFEDEYEIKDNTRTPFNDNRFPGLNIHPPNAQGYGDKDLYPGGQKFPDFNNPVGGILEDPTYLRGQGGMAFDPKIRPGDSRNRGPGYISGSKYDDPLGNHSDATDGFNNDNSGGPGFGGPGFGGPGFGASGFGGGFM
ncbi:hypothetical protein TPHA_0M01890 [Tetrapisispora phaffii CBS 4417]|uniref:PI31 proteasome regulator C-terminal domain-containing protein n=1 Tax=Tetrapisispora phaffii (strain ATCC 24235 / CBS 4417 / NBRC 1672 / NRRL Y-8282 / UCD 70-5) TaxID=1071381 RepID=G8C0P9_TETPH|nr:hypothetical protein TPHA_0M01890 [Tetrapisispora phaffii CBS 4417]CCE65764.1 hypothetical protein TPHA_0M01890 [Tetrapisispora phaffii CBS 4417]